MSTHYDTLTLLERKTSSRLSSIILIIKVAQQFDVVLLRVDLQQRSSIRLVVDEAKEVAEGV